MKPYNFKEELDLTINMIVNLQKLSATQTMFLDSQKCFEEAIKENRLSDNPNADNFAGNYMYMGTKNSVHMFKNINTREYLK